MAGARVRWRQNEEHFEVIGHGVLWFSDSESILGASDVAAAASLTELRNALDRYRRLMYDVEATLEVFDVDEALLLADEDAYASRAVRLELTQRHTFVEIELVVDPDIRFDRHEVAQRLWPQLHRHNAVVVALSEEQFPLFNLARLTVEISPRGKSVGDALDAGDDLLTLWSASVTGAVTPESIADLIRAQRPELLIGQAESVYFEAKGGEYDLKDDRSAIELAKDVAALANRREGGVLVLGLTTRKRDGQDVVHAVRPLPPEKLPPRRYQQSLDKWVFPRPQDLVIETIEIEPDGALMFILVPPQPDALHPFLVTGAIQDGRVLGNHFSLVRRRGDETALTQAEAVHGLMVAGRAALATAANARSWDEVKRRLE